MGWVLFIFGYLLFWASNLQKTDFLILLPSYITMIFGVGFLLLKEWRNNKNSQKKISLLAIGCFVFGLIPFLPFETFSDWRLLTSLGLSLILGIIFRVKNKKEEGRLIGNSLSMIGFILSGTILVCALLFILFPVK